MMRMSWETVLGDSRIKMNLEDLSMQINLEGVELKKALLKLLQYYPALEIPPLSIVKEKKKLYFILRWAKSREISSYHGNFDPNSGHWEVSIFVNDEQFTSIHSSSKGTLRIKGKHRINTHCRVSLNEVHSQ